VTRQMAHRYYVEHPDDAFQMAGEPWTLGDVVRLLAYAAGVIVIAVLMWAIAFLVAVL
jgi:hypothetical protein